MAKTKHEFASFAAPSPEDVAAFDALSEEEQKAVIEEELAKGFTGETYEATPDLKARIMAAALERLKQRHTKF
jgi:hypothetical protein